MSVDECLGEKEKDDDEKAEKQS